MSEIEMLREEVQMLTAELEFLKANIDAVVENHLRAEREQQDGGELCRCIQCKATFRGACLYCKTCRQSD